ncbi:M48 family metallopeptidase [Alkalilimnicola ehrlichii]|uniref:Peptidase n=1 Tax=Alkalilimnicola ehrlichii TaxID=351052 RepID=A0A3E0WQ29_9GAMM|nr:M48 family metallopeptidase [Alkalilimnicola ehrlichii]RFA34096.1 peptidase [Alkalilimnicola ehrlichii]
MMYRVLTLVAVALILAACTTSPTGRTQLQLFPSEQIDEMGAAAFATIQEELPVSDDEAMTAYVTCVADQVTEQLDGEEGEIDWDVVLFDEPSPNAFALPGGRIGVHSGLLDVAQNQDQLATVIAHEVAHVLADHSNERISTAYATEAGLRAVEALAGDPSREQSQLMGLLGVGAQFGILLPFSRSQEREADIIGLDLMADAGFDPRESVRLWQNMAAAANGEPPEFLSTHPSHGRRMDDLQAGMPNAMTLYEEAREQGREPDCQ